jgi:transcriptional regulator with XRE-family HTH domain
MFGEKIKELRTQRSLSQKQLANILNVHKATISLYESNSRFPSVDILKAAARYFHVSTDYLLEMNSARTLDVSSLTDEQISVVEQMIHILQESKK